MSTDTRKIAVIGSGKIGELVIAHLSTKYPLAVYDMDLKRAEACAAGVAEAHQLDVNDGESMRAALKDKALVINCCPHFCNLAIATAAADTDTSYLDMSEDVETGHVIEELSKKVSGNFVPRCGIAPGFIQIVAGHIMRNYADVERAHLRVGALPENPTNALKYNLTWSTDGLINEYGNPCEAIVDGKLTQLRPLEGYEQVVIDGVEYEAFNTSGGLGTLAHSMLGKARNLNYKTMRYIGHRDLMKFLMFDLKLNEYRTILKQILESAVPTTKQDRVVVLVTVVGRTEQGILTQQTYTKIVKHGELYGRHWTAIQISTASSAAAVADLVMRGLMPHRGYVQQEEIDFSAFCDTPFGQLFKE
ncbi:MAG: saccharopine dehydrogenase family protein [Phycisphaera sp.]|nr:saccharopine dehydrogenase family protein [Phycisphaera sp.]